jgi:hypothetical protein
MYAQPFSLSTSETTVGIANRDVVDGNASQKFLCDGTLIQAYPVVRQPCREVCAPRSPVSLEHHALFLRRIHIILAFLGEQAASAERTLIFDCRWRVERWRLRWVARVAVSSFSVSLDVDAPASTDPNAEYEVRPIGCTRLREDDRDAVDTRDLRAVVHCRCEVSTFHRVHRRLIEQAVT